MPPRDGRRQKPPQGGFGFIKEKRKKREPRLGVKGYSPKIDY